MLLRAAREAFGAQRLIVYGSRLDDARRGGDFDLAVVTSLDRSAFRQAKVRFFKYLLLRDLDLPIDLVSYHDTHGLLRQEIDRGMVIEPIEMG
jgi:predicted nucleotidyltransferase